MSTGRPSEERRYLVKTGDGDVVVAVNPEAGGLDDHLFALLPATSETTAGITMATPLTAFSAKVVDIIELHGTDTFPGSPQMREMMVREKATALLRQIERFARQGR